MSTFWLTYSPRRPGAQHNGWRREDLEEFVGRFKINPNQTTAWWRFAAINQGTKGDRVYLFKQGDDPRGIFGVGWIIGGPERIANPYDHLGVVRRAHIKFEVLVNPHEEFLLSLDEMKETVSTERILNNLINAEGSGITVDPQIASELEERLQTLSAFSVPSLDAREADDLSIDPDSAGNERERKLRAIRVRRGQADFRVALIEAYGGKCVVTGCPIVDVLEAAHIIPEAGRRTSVVNNGLLLRADIHTLFDLYLLAIHPDTRKVVLAESLMNSTYARLVNRTLLRPKDDYRGPAKNVLRWRYAKFEAQQKTSGWPAAA